MNGLPLRERMFHQKEQSSSCKTNGIDISSWLMQEDAFFVDACGETPSLVFGAMSSK